MSFHLPLVTAFGLGMIHAIEPGHGKSLVSIYLIGNRSTWQQALALGLVIAFSHTFSVLAIGSLSAFALQQWASSQEELIHWLEIIAGAIIIGVGAMMMLRAKTLTQNTPSHEEAISVNDENHCHHKHCDFDTTHPPSNLKEIFMLGIASGFCPSPLPLILLMSAFSLGGFGEFYTAVSYLFSFSLGLALTVTLLGLILIKSKNSASPLLSKLPANWGTRFNQLSALLIMLLGLYIIIAAQAHH